MDEYFEKVKADFLEVEPFDLLQTNAFYNQYKDYLSENIPTDKDDFEIYLEILADIGMTFAAKQKYEEALPILKKVVKKIKDSKEVKFWLGMIYSNLDKPILAYYYLSRGEPENGNNPQFFQVLQLTKKDAIQKIYNVLNYFLLSIYGVLVSSKWIFGEIKNYWLNILSDVLLVYSLLIILRYTYQYLKFKARKK